jgi:hypothetical protein
MSFVINRALLDQTTFTSASPAGLACVVHPVAHDGEHELHVLDDAGQISDLVHMTVVKQPATGAQPATTLAVNAADLRAARLKRGVSAPADHQVLQAGAHLFVNTPVPADARRIRMVRKTDGAVVFDSASLGEGDRFAVTLIRPGRYQLENQLGGQKLALTVEYPVRGKQPYQPPPPMQIECTATGFKAPAATVFKPAQGLVVLCSVPARLHLALVEPDDGPHGPPRVVVPPAGGPGHTR